MAVAVTFATIPELFQNLTAKFAAESRPLRHLRTGLPRWA
jgi:hypothetical protein